MITEMSLSAVIKRRRVELGLKQKDVADIIDLPPSVLNRFEKGVYPMLRENTILKLAEVLRLDSDSLLLLASLNTNSLADFNQNYPMFSSLLQGIDALMGPKHPGNSFQKVENTLQLFRSQWIELSFNFVSFFCGTLGMSEDPRNDLPLMGSIFDHMNGASKFFTVEQKRDYCSQIRTKMEKIRALSSIVGVSMKRSEESSETQPASSGPSVKPRKPIIKGGSDSLT
jgi:transcriptional regulator with XRE-family HTH domain